MKKFKKIIHLTSALLAVAVALLFSAIAWADYSLSDNYFVVEGTQFSANCQVPITTEFIGVEASQELYVDSRSKSEYSVNFKLLGLFPVSQANVTVISPTAVRLLGTPFGIKIYTDGVLVIELQNVDGKNGAVNPAKSAGIKVGDTIKSINGKAVYCNEDVAAIVEESCGKEMTLVIEREGVIKSVKLKPVLSQSAGIYRIGAWVRDSTAGIGTLTFYSPATNVVCGLGHGICDDDTKTLMSVKSGELVAADIVSCKKGVSGTPGELKGRLCDSFLGTLLKNDTTGVYAESESDFADSQLMSIAVKQEIENGPAYIYTTVDGDTPQYYTCNIEIRRSFEKENTHNMTVTVTDERLIDKTGGIVQGMCVCYNRDNTGKAHK